MSMIRTHRNTFSPFFLNFQYFINYGNHWHIALQMIVFKCLGEMIEQPLRGNEPYDGYLYATFGVGALLFALLEILAIGGFKPFQATVILPVYHVILLIVVLVLGSIFFKEDALKLEGFLPGVLLIFTGIYVLG